MAEAGIDADYTAFLQAYPAAYPTVVAKVFAALLILTGLPLIAFHFLYRRRGRTPYLIVWAIDMWTRVAANMWHVTTTVAGPLCGRPRRGPHVRPPRPAPASGRMKKAT